MIKIKVIEVDCIRVRLPEHENRQLGPVEDFIAQIGYQNIKEIKIQSTAGGSCYYHIFYEDILPYTPRPTPEKKGLFG